MAVKGSVDTKIDPSAMEEIIVFAHKYGNTMSENATAIAKECRRMLDDETLKGGDGEAFRESFGDIAKGATNLEKSTQKIIRVLDDKLGVAVDMRHGKNVGSAKEDMARHAAKAGALKE